LAHSYEVLIAARVVTGLFGGVIGSISMAIVADIFPLEQRGRVMGFMQMVFGASQVLGIPISLFLANHLCWQSPFLMIVGLAIIIWVGLIITVQAFQIVPSRHVVAVVVGLLPALAAWGALLGKNALRAVSYGTPGHEVFSPELLEVFRREKFALEGAFALEQGFIYCALIWSAMTYYIVERQFARAAVWSVLAAVLAMLGLMHSWKFTASDTVISVPLLDMAVGESAGSGWASLFPAWPFAMGYGLFTLLLLAAHRWAKPMPNHD